MAHCKCQQCGKVATDLEWLAAPNAACPTCGHKTFTMEFQSTLQLLPTGALKITTRDPHHKSDKKIRLKHFVGPTLNAAGEPMHKEQLIDRDTNYYFEKVVDLTTGETTRLCEEKLTDHTGRGSDRTKK
jgi:DNA-directed RNA polymerase subunit RPC12/RpoP